VGRAIVLATPVFLALIALGYAWGRRTGRNTYGLADAVSSIALGIMSRYTAVFTRLLRVGVHAAAASSLSLVPAEAAAEFWTSPLGWVLALAFYDFCCYWLHRAGHESAIFWAAHVVHHQSRHYNLSTALRQTSSDALLGWVVYLPMAVAGVPPEVFAIVALVDLLYRFWVHTEHVGKRGAFDRWFVSPSNHRVHHAIQDGYLDRNCDGVLVVRDRLFGTSVEEGERCTYGTRKPLDSWDPVWANVEVYAGIARDAWHARDWRDKARVVFGRPGWRPADVAARFPVATLDPARPGRFDPEATPTARALAIACFVVALGATTAFLWEADTLPVAVRAIGGGRADRGAGGRPRVGDARARLQAAGARPRGRVGVAALACLGLRRRARPRTADRGAGRLARRRCRADGARRLPAGTGRVPARARRVRRAVRARCRGAAEPRRGARGRGLRPRHARGAVAAPAGGAARPGRRLRRGDLGDGCAGDRQGARAARRRVGRDRGRRAALGRVGHGARARPLRRAGAARAVLDPVDLLHRAAADRAQRASRSARSTRRAASGTPRPMTTDPHALCEQRWFEDFRVGERFPLPSRTMTEALFAAFQLASGDNHPSHYDVEYCRAHGHAGLLAHGFQVLVQTAAGAGLFPHIVEDSMKGFIDQSSRFLKPVIAGDTLRCSLEVAELEPGRTTGVVAMRSTVVNQRGELVMDGTQRYLLKRRVPLGDAPGDAPR
jgi:sterol desaturase/sphingolipid hydroxylase (fatty acid hydroxylase superfamily)/acyl dehydratase